MKNLKITLITLLLIAPFITNAQFKFGAGGGLNFANFSGDNLSGTESLVGFNAGVMMEVKLPVKIGVEADVLFSTKGAGGFIFSNEIGDPIGTDDLKLSYIDIPVVLKIYTLKVISFQLGPQYSILTSAKLFDEDIKDNFKSGDFSAVVGIGIDVSKLHVSARYNFGLTNISAFGDLKNNMLTISVGYWLKK